MSDCNTPCDPCNEHDNCGCLHPTTFGCVTTTKTRECLETSSGENGEDILDKIDEAICDIGKVLLDADDACPEYLSEKISAGLNIDISYTGEGCDRTMVISATEGGVPVDVNVKVSADDTTSGYLYDKIQTGTYLTKSEVTPAGNEKLRIDVVPATLVSADVGNQLTLGGDGKLKTLYTAPDGSETVVIAGTAVTVSGTGTIIDPYIISTNPSIVAARPCFDATWRAVTLVASGNPSVVYASGAPQYRYRFDGTVEFRGSITYNVAFGTYVSASRKFTIPMGNIPTTCLTAGEMIGTKDLKGINYIDAPQAGADQYAQQYGYIIRMSAQNLILEFQSSFLNATAKSIVVNFEGAVIHPQI
jgi:hypothetical protein